MPALAQLRAEALAARARGEPKQAVETWRALLDAAPDDWRLALQLRHDLREGWHYPESDPRFRRAARHLPDGEWLAHYASLPFFHGSDLDAIDARARALLVEHPQDGRLHGILGEVARQRRDWSEAVLAFTAASFLSPIREHFLLKAEAARFYERLSTNGWGQHGSDYVVYVINLDRNAERMAEIERRFAGSAVPLHRHPATEGSGLPAAIVHDLTGDVLAPRGTLGCFLSHTTTWQALIASGVGHGLILEDDVIPLLALPPSLGTLGLPEGFDLCFVNDRLEPRLDYAIAEGLTTWTLAAAMMAFDPHDNAPGGDGYIISRTGAAKLLQWVTDDGMAHDVDWRLLAYALTPDAIAAIPSHCYARTELEKVQAVIGRTERLAAYVLHPALVRTVGVSSDREDQNRLAAGRSTEATASSP